MVSSNASRPECQPKCCPILRQSPPNENFSHVTCQPAIGKTKLECVQPECDAGLPPNFPVSDDPSACRGCYDVETGHQRQCECEQCVQKRKEAAEKGGFCPQHSEGAEWQDLKKYSHDPEVQEIRDRLGSSQNVQRILRWCPDDETLTCVDRRFRQAKTGLLGKPIVHYGSAQDCDFPREMTHGVRSSTFNEVKKIVNPPINTWAEQLELDLKESVYASNRYAPIGRSHDQLANLPAKIIPEEAKFGMSSDKSVSVALLVNPPKDRFEVEQESECCRQMYRKTHGDYNAGEQICRNYTQPFDRLKSYGIPTPCDNTGRWAKKIMSSWRSCQPDFPYVNKTYADHLDMRYPKLGLPQDMQCLAREKGDGHVYGSKPKTTDQEQPIREVIFNRCPNPEAAKVEKLMHSLFSWLEKVRRILKSEFGPDAEELYEAFLARDKGRSGIIDWDGFMKCIREVRAPCLENKQEFMDCLALVNIYHPLPCNQVNYYYLMDFIKGHEDPKFSCRTTTLKPYYLPWTNGCIHFRTTYSDFAANWCLRESCLQHLREQTIHGARDIIRESDVYSLICPSSYTLRGITCKDAFRELTREQMRKLMCDAAVNISLEEFDKVWEKAEKLDPQEKKRVCFQTFREALHITRDSENKMFGYSEEHTIQDGCPPKAPEECYPRQRIKDFVCRPDV